MRWTIALAFALLARAALAEPVADKVFFAGEAASADAFATAHGAWQSGIDAVEAVKKVLGQLPAQLP